MFGTSTSDWLTENSSLLGSIGAIATVMTVFVPFIMLKIGQASSPPISKEKTTLKTDSDSIKTITSEESNVIKMGDIKHNKQRKKIQSNTMNTMQNKIAEMTAARNQKRLALLLTQLEALQDAYDLETRPEEKIRLQPRIEEKQADIDALASTLGN
jgi:hypothetical protein